MKGPFQTAEALLTAYEQGELVRCVADDWKDSNYDSSWSRTDDRTEYGVSIVARNVTPLSLAGFEMELKSLRLGLSTLMDRDSLPKSTMKVLLSL